MEIAHIIASTEKLPGALLGAPRYETFQKIFNIDHKYRFIPYEEFKKGIKGEKTQHYSFENGILVPQESKELSIDVILIEYYDAPNIVEKKKDMFDVVPRYTKKNNIILVNNAYSLYSQDKKFLYDRQNKFIVAPSKTYHFTDKKDLANLMGQKKDYIIKPRFGSEGKGVEKLNKDSLSKIINISDYIIQEETKNILGEMRFIYTLNGTFLGSRFILDRTKPWEKNLKEISDKKIHINIPILPSKELIDKAREIYHISFCEVASVDFFITNTEISPKEIYEGQNIQLGLLEKILQVKDNYTLVEVNGFGTGFGNHQSNIFLMTPNEEISDLNEEVAVSIKKYLESSSFH